MFLEWKRDTDVFSFRYQASGVNVCRSVVVDQSWERCKDISELRLSEGLYCIPALRGCGEGSEASGSNTLLML